MVYIIFLKNQTPRSVSPGTQQEKLELLTNYCNVILPAGSMTYVLVEESCDAETEKSISFIVPEKVIVIFAEGTQP